LQNGNEEVGSYQLRKKKSNKPSGFVDVSIRVSEDKEEPNSHSGIWFIQKLQIINKNGSFFTKFFCFSNVC
jgi:hypothetical protein